MLYRLRVVSLTLPPLRERAGDIEILARHFLEHYCDIHNRPCRQIADDVLELMRMHAWPGNVRELMHCVESMAVMSQSEVITLNDVPDFVSFADAAETTETGVLADMERRMIAEMLRETSGNKVDAARKLGIGLRTLYRKIEKWAL